MALTRKKLPVRPDNLNSDDWAPYLFKLSAVKLKSELDYFATAMHADAIAQGRTSAFEDAELMDSHRVPTIKEAMGAIQRELEKARRVRESVRIILNDGGELMAPMENTNART